MANQQVKYTITGENLLSKVLKQVDVDAQKAENSVKNVSKAATNKTGGGGGMLGSVVGGNLIANGVTKIGGALIGFGKDVVESLTNYEYFSSSLKTLMLGDALAAKALESNLVSLAKTTPFSLVDVQQGTKQLLAYGFAAGEVVSTMKTLGDVSAGVGKPLTEVAYLYGTLKTQGRAFSKDINQFTTAGIPIRKELAKQFKVTEDAVMDLVTAGKVGFPEVEKAFKSMTSEGAIFFNLMDEQAKTVGGKISAIGDSWEQLKVNLGKSQHGLISFIVDITANITKRFNDKVEAENFIDEATKKHGGKGYGFFDRYFGAGNYKSNEDQGIYMQSLIEQSTSGKKAQEMLKYVDYNKSKLEEKRKKGWVDEEDYKNEMALYTETYQQIAGKMKLLLGKTKAPALINENDIEDKNKNKNLGTGVTIEAQVPKNQYITINGGLVHNMTIESMDGSTPVAQIKEQVSTAMVELLNDAYQAIR